MTTDHEAAKEWAANGYHNHGVQDCPECNLAACYLELRELAKAMQKAWDDHNHPSSITLAREPTDALRRAFQTAENLPFPKDGDAIRQEWLHLLAAAESAGKDNA